MSGLVIKKYSNGTIEISCDECDDKRKYIFYSERGAVKDYRIRNGLVGKHLNRVYMVGD